MAATADYRVETDSSDDDRANSGLDNAADSRKGKRGRGAPRASKACRECRRRKARCDNKQPVCSGCLRLRAVCEYADDGRKVAKSQVATLRARLAELERKVHNTAADDNTQDKSAQRPLQQQEQQQQKQTQRQRPQQHWPVAVQGQQASEPALDTLSLPPSHINRTEDGATTAVSSPQAPLPAPPSAGPSFSGLSPPAPSLPSLSPPSQADLTSSALDFARPVVPATIQRDIEAVDGQRTPFGAGTDAPLAGQIIGIKGKLSVSDGGVLRWYGATSNRHLSFGVLSNFRAPQKDVHTRCREALARSGEVVTVDERLEQRLLALYEVWHNQFFHISDNAVFRAHRQRYLKGEGNHQFFSFTLWYAMLAYASPLSNETKAFMRPDDEDPGDIWARKARICLDEEMQCPQETTVQALAILAAREVCSGRDARGWSYIVSAAGCAVDLGLHSDVAELVEVGGMTQEQFRMRCIIWWGVYEYASLWGLYVGRPSIINVQQINCPHPSMTDGQTFTASLVSLIQISNSITKELYSGSHLIAPPDSATVLDMHQRLLEWHSSLPATETLDLELQPSPPPHVILLHLQYYALMILLHRPFVSIVPVASSSFEICCTAAASSAFLLELYRRQYTFQRIGVVAVHQVFTAATTLVYIIHASDEARAASRPVPACAASARSHLLVCLAALSAMATRQAHAQRSYLSIIILMKRSHVTLDNAAKPISVSQPQSQAQNKPKNAPPAQDVPPNELFESLAQSLFEISDVTDRPLNWDEVLAMPSVRADANGFELPQTISSTGMTFTHEGNTTLDNHGAQDAVILSGTVNAAIPSNPNGIEPQPSNGFQQNPAIMDFFDILSSQSGAQAVYDWQGPSLTDMFDILPP
ncbi:hypothetical protein OIO90_003779 [Microbotryomycetes sp. JL221]|nr:hypothetical protein OIO90_003779 [Microbotryomycetes sp. JL221]